MGESDATFAWILAASIAVVLLLEVKLSRHFDPLAPPVMLCIFVALGYLLPYPFVKAELDPFSIFWPYRYSNMEAAVGKALMLASVALGAFYLGYTMTYRWRGLPPRASARLELDERRARTVAWAYTGFALVMVGVGIALIGGFDVLISGLGDRTRLFAGLNYFFSTLMLPLGVVLLLVAGAFDADRKLSVSLWGYAVVAFLAASLLGAKSALYVFIVALITLYHYSRRRLSVAQLGAYGLVAFVGLMLYQVFVREFLVIGEVVSWEGSWLTGQSLLFLADQFSGNFMQLQCLSILVDSVGNELQLQHGKTLATLFTAPIPSSIFPSKPITAPGVFTIGIWPGRWYEEGTTLPPGIIGEFYLNFGTAGVALGSFVLGATYGASFRRAVSASGALSLIAYALYAALLLHFVRGEFTSPMVLWLMMIVPIWIARSYACRLAAQ